MTDLAISTQPKQMKTIITLLNLIKGELFVTIDHAERCLEMFISERQSNASLQQFIQALQQIRGSLTLLEITGASKLADLMLERALAIPTDANEEWDNTLTVLSTAIFTLRRYLENLGNYPDLLCELLIPVINELRATEQKSPLPDSYFTGISLSSSPPLPNEVPETVDADLFGRLRQMYQVGLLGLIKEENIDASLRMMSRAMDRLQHSLNDENAVRLCWIASAAIESFTDSKMTPYPTRKRLFSRVDQQLRKAQINHEAPHEPLIKDLLYTTLLDNSLGMKALAIFSAYNLTPLTYTNKILEEEKQKLAGPGQSAVCSFTSAVREELIQAQESINAFTDKKEDHQTLLKTLITNLKHLLKTISLVDLTRAEILLKEQITAIEQRTELDSNALDHLADVILHVEDIIMNFENGASCYNRPALVKTINDEDNSSQYLKQGRILAFQESLNAIGSAQQSIVGYLESKGNKQYLEQLPNILNEIYGCLLFLNQERAAKIIRQCTYYIDAQMLHTNTLPDNKQLDNLADILASLEFFIETGVLVNSEADTKILELAEESLATLNVPDIDLPAQDSSKTPKATVKESLHATISHEETVIKQTKKTENTTPIPNFDDIDPFASFNFKTNGSQQHEATIPVLEDNVEPVVTANNSSPSKLSLEPMAQQIDTEEETSATQPAIKVEKNDDDDIQFTRPQNWTLS